MSAVRKIKPQEGPQKEFLSTKADIAIYGGGAGGGKSYAALLDPLRYLHKRNVDAVIFRRTTKQITNPGGLWDDASNIYPLVGMHPRQSGFLDWKMPGGLTVKFAHMEHEHNKYDWQGSAIPIIIFDELTHFSRTQFFYMLSRNRSVTGVPGYVRATCNPDADSWVAKFISWWIDEETGFPIPERDGVLRWFIKDGDDMVWGDSKEDLAQHYPPEVVKYAKSVTFIRARVTDNKLLMEKNPEYLANLNALDRVERSRLLDGNWKIRAASGEYFTRSDFEIIDTLPADVIRSVRYWDRAATKPSKANPNPDWTVGVKMHVTRNGLYIIEHVERFRDGPLGNEKKIKNITSSDKVRVTVGIEQDPGQAGKVEAQNWTRTLAGYDVRLFPVHKDKVTRATPYAAQVQAGNVKLMEGSWNDTFINEHESFPPEDNPRKKKENPESVGKDDQVDAASGAFNFLTGENVGQAKPPDSDSSTITGFLDNTEQW